MHLVSKLCCNLSWMTELQRKNTLKNLKIEEEKRKNKVDGIIKEIATKEIDYLRKSSLSPPSFSWIPKVEKEYVLPPVTLITACLLEGLEYSLAQGASLTIFGMFLGSFMSLKEVRQEKDFLEEGQKELKKERGKFDKEKFEFDKEQLNLELNRKKIEVQKTLLQIDAAETREAYLKTVTGFLA